MERRLYIGSLESKSAAEARKEYIKGLGSATRAFSTEQVVKRITPKELHLLRTLSDPGLFLLPSITLTTLLIMPGVV